MKKIRLIPVIVSLIVSASVLFGGFFMYRTVAMQNPLTDAVKQSAGVQDAQISITDQEVVINAKLDPNANLREIYQSIMNKGASIIGQREVKLNVVQQPSPELEQWWSKALFDVAQSMEKKEYAKIPESLDKQASNVAGLKAATEMDGKNVYIHLSKGDQHKYIILPRIPAKMGVWQ